MGEALAQNVRLRTVDLSNNFDSTRAIGFNNIGNEGGIAIGEALKTNHTLVDLYVSMCLKPIPER